MRFLRVVVLTAAVLSFHGCNKADDKDEDDAKQDDKNNELDDATELKSPEGDSAKCKFYYGSPSHPAFIKYRRIDGGKFVVDNTEGKAYGCERNDENPYMYIGGSKLDVFLQHSTIAHGDCDKETQDEENEAYKIPATESRSAVGMLAALCADKGLPKTDRPFEKCVMKISDSPFTVAFDELGTPEFQCNGREVDMFPLVTLRGDKPGASAANCLTMLFNPVFPCLTQQSMAQGARTWKYLTDPYGDEPRKLSDEELCTAVEERSWHLIRGKGSKEDLRVENSNAADGAADTFVDVSAGTDDEKDEKEKEDKKKTTKKNEKKQKDEKKKEEAKEPKTKDDKASKKNEKKDAKKKADEQSEQSGKDKNKEENKDDKAEEEKE